MSPIMIRTPVLLYKNIIATNTARKDLIMKKKFKLSTFTKYLLSYILPLIFPIIMMTAYINATLFTEMSKMYQKESQLQLKEIGITFIDTIDRLKIIGEHILMNREILPEPNIQDVNKSIKTIVELKKYAISNNDVEDIAMYVEDDSFLYTSYSTYPINKLSNLPYFNKNIPDNFGNIFEHREIYDIEESINFFKDYSNYNILSQVMKIKNKNVLIMFVLKKDAVNKVLDDNIYYFLDKYDNILFTNTKDDISLYENNKKYVKTSYRTEKYNFNFYKYSNYEVLFKDMIRIKKIFIIMMFVLFVLGSALVIYLMFKNYTPIKAVSEKIRANHKSDVHSIEDIQNAVVSIVDENKALKQSTQVDEFLYALLNGHITMEEQFNETINELGLRSLNANAYYVAVLYFKDYDISNREIDSRPSLTHKDLFKLVKMTLNNEAQGYVLSTFAKGKIIFIGSCDSEDSNSPVMSMLNTQECLKNKVENINICLGNSYNDFLKIPQSYLDASLAVDYRFIKGNNTIIESKNLLVNQDFSKMYPKNLFDQIQYFIESGETDKLSDALNQFITYIKSTDLPLYYVKGLCYNLISIISEIVDKINVQINKPKNRLSYACVLVNYDTIEELVNVINNIANNINMYLKENEELNGNLTINKIKKYIDNNAFSQNFSVQLLADEFNMSYSSISSFFKYHTGETILDYVSQLRMTKAKELLLLNKYTVNKITEMVGYVNVSSFIRKFKQYYGFTPTEFIKQNRGNEINE